MLTLFCLFFLSFDWISYWNDDQSKCSVYLLFGEFSVVIWTTKTSQTLLNRFPIDRAACFNLFLPQTILQCVDFLKFWQGNLFICVDIVGILNSWNSIFNSFELVSHLCYPWSSYRRCIIAFITNLFAVFWINMALLLFVFQLLILIV